MYQRKDRFYTRAKQTGLRSRAAFKLEELARDAKLFRTGGRVVDLGAWPGGWLQMAAAAVGPQGVVVGIDLQAIPALTGLPQVRLLQGDMTDPASLGRIRELLGGEADVVLSDLAPKLTGIRDRDVTAMAELIELARVTAIQLLRPGGSFVVKLFMSEEVAPFVRRLRDHFGEVRTTRPEATRKGSAEIYALARQFRRPHPESPPVPF